MTPFIHASKSFKRLNPGVFPAPVAAGLQDAKSEHAPAQALGSSEARQGRSETGGAPRAGVRITLCRCRLLDADNAYGSAKWILDALVAEGVLAGDGPEQIDLNVEQRQVPTQAEEGTEITITPLTAPTVPHQLLLSVR